MLLTRVLFSYLLIYKANLTPTLTIIINTKNEAKNIRDCILSCKDIASEILVVDMKSSDKTREKARSLGARVITVQDFGYVEPARQIALDLAKSDWIFVLDCDERLSPELRSHISELISLPESFVFKFPRKNILFNKWLKHGLLWPDYQIRLFRRGCVQWPTVIHSHPQTNKKIKTLPLTEEYAIIHRHSTSLHERLMKVESQAFHEETYKAGRSVSTKRLFQQISSEFPKRYFNEQGYKDGMPGFINAKLMEYYQFLSFAKYWEDNQYPELFTPQEQFELWDTNRQLQLLIKENKQLSDSKFYKIYTSIKKIFFHVNLKK